MAVPHYPHPHKMKVAEIKAAIAELEAIEAAALAKAEAAYTVEAEAEYAAEAYEAMMAIAPLAVHLPTKH